MTANLTWRDSKVSPADRVRLLRQKPLTVWLTGLSGSGKSTIAFELERRLVAAGRACFVLDGDNVRHNLNSDLGFSPSERKENIRRIAEVARLFNEAGLVVITAFISPYRADRAMARNVVGHHRFIETHLTANLQICETRDTKGLYAKARAGKILDFTGVSAPYEPPERPELVVATGTQRVEESVAQILSFVEPWLRAENFEPAVPRVSVAP